jgi:hypothetical protein
MVYLVELKIAVGRADPAAVSLASAPSFGFAVWCLGFRGYIQRFSCTCTPLGSQGLDIHLV